MKYAIIAALILISSPAYADDDYNSGYNSGYYTGSLIDNPSSNYGRGVEDGAYDSDQDDAEARQRSIEFENSLAQQDQSSNNNSDR